MKISSIRHKQPNWHEIFQKWISKPIMDDIHYRLQFQMRIEEKETDWFRGGLLDIGYYMNTEKMRAIAVVVHLTIHKIGFHVKFPATLSLQLELDRKTTSILDGILLGKQTIQANKQSRFQAVLNYDESNKTYENKKATILICIKTKTSENKLTAGVIPISLTGPNQHNTNTIAKPLRCNDPKAFIEYSLRAETLRKMVISPQQSTSSHAADMLQTKKAIFKSAVYYNNTFNDQEDPEQERSTSKNELDKYISGPLAKDQKKRYKSSGKLPLRTMENCEDDDSRTEVISYRKEKFQNDASIVSSRHSIEKQARQLSKRSEAFSKEVSEARLIQQNLKVQNKQLRTKISKHERELDEQSSQIVQLNKRLEMRESSSAEQARQLRAKLAEVETQLHQLLLEKNQYLNQMEAKEKEAVALIKEKEKTIAQGKRKHALELQLKRQQKESIINEKNQVTDSLNHSQKMLTDLIVQMQAKQKQCQTLQKSLESLKLEMFEKLNALHGLQTQIVGKEKAVEDLKAQKKLIYEIKHERDQKDIVLAQSTATIKELQLNLAQKDEQSRKKTSQIDNLGKENQTLKNQLKQQNAKQSELEARLKQYEVQLKRSADNSSKIGKQIMQVECELKGIKKQANNQATEKTKLMEDYQEMLAVLQEKIAMIQEEKGASQREIVGLNHLCKQKEEECYDLGQQLIISKEEANHLANQIQLIRQQNHYLTKTVQELTQKEQRLFRAEQRLQYNQRLYEQLQQKHELQRIQLQGQIRGLQDRNQQKSQALRNLSDQLRKTEREQLQLQDQIQTLKIGLANRTSELNFLKIQMGRNRDNSIQFQQRMAVLRRTEQNASSTVDELREETENLRREVKENAQAINKLAKRYDSLYRSTFQAINQLFDLIRSQKSIMNSNVRHEKVQISSLFNDCIRHISLQRQNTAANIEKLSKALEQQTAANKENVKIIRLKAQMQKELQQEMLVMKAHVQSLQSTIVKLERDIQNHLQAIKQRQTVIADLNSDIVSIRKEHSNQLAKKDELIQKGAKEIDRLSYQIQLDAQKHNANIDKVKLAMANLEAELQAKISNLNQILTEVNGELKQERDISKQQRLKINEIQSANAKLNKQKQDISNDLEKRTNELIAARLESENRYKTLMDRESQINNLQKSIQRLTNDKNNLTSKISKCEQINRQLSIKKAESQASLKERNNEILLLKMKIDELQEAKNKLIQQRQDLIKNKGIQQTLVSTLNQSIRSLKDAAIVSEDRIKKLNFEKECTEKENSKKLNIINSEKAVLERQLSELKAKLSQKQTDFASKQRALQDQIKLFKTKMNENSILIADLRKELQAGNTKMSSLLSDFNAKTAQLQSKQKSLLPSAGKLKEVMQSISELRSIGKQYEASKSKLLRLTNSTRFEEQEYERVCEVARQLGVAINKVKIQVLNRLKISTEMKATLLQALKSLQIIAEKLNRH